MRDSHNNHGIDHEGREKDGDQFLATVVQSQELQHAWMVSVIIRKNREIDRLKPIEIILKAHKNLELFRIMGQVDLGVLN